MRLVLLFLLMIQLSYASFPESLAGKTFAHPGPNCFGVAMYVSQSIHTIRGVDLKEFTAFVDSYCETVAKPMRGDIGTFRNQTDFIHAFVYLGNDLVLEKTGVDYLGKTPIHKRNISHTIYTFEASPECRRWGAGSGDCYNTLNYFRCAQAVNQPYSTVSLLEEKIELIFEEVLSGNPRQFTELSGLIQEYKRVVEKEDDPLLRGRLESYQKQLEFINL